MTVELKSASMHRRFVGLLFAHPNLWTYIFCGDGGGGGGGAMLDTPLPTHVNIK